ncbi:MAG: hypothetical protein QXZ41_02485 [Ignisphaera sp.]|uniref:Uncharacterized protein n=1 Tax=Ignisphaera aggregans TaxID=334771 RepID=A0A7C4NM85_9CREN
MFFSYRKSPLGTIVREHTASILGVYNDRNEAEKDLEHLRGRISAELRIIDLLEVEGWEKMIKLDSDLADVVKSFGGRYALIAFWGSSEP